METKDRVKAIIKAAGLSQNRFADRYAIPKNTVHNWCQGANEPPAYLIDLLAKDTAAQKTIAMAWVWNEHRSKPESGHYEIFTDQNEATYKAMYSWEQLPAGTKRSYIMDAGGEYSVCLYRMKYDEEAQEFVPDFEAGAVARVWSPLI